MEYIKGDTVDYISREKRKELLDDLRSVEIDDFKNKNLGFETCPKSTKRA